MLLVQTTMNRRPVLDTRLIFKTWLLLARIWYETALRNSDGVTPYRGAEYRWAINFFCYFSPITRYISQTIQDSTIVTMES